MRRGRADLRGEFKGDELSEFLRDVNHGLGSEMLYFQFGMSAESATDSRSSNTN